MDTDDRNLLRQYAEKHSQEAFAVLVSRHVNLVYSVALRLVRSPQLAEEVSQSVFTDLARQAPHLAADTILTAWLYQVARRTAIDVIRHESRRQLREQVAYELTAMNATAADWTHVEPLLDEAMQALDDTDRAVVLLRYFENRSLREVGETLGTSDDAAQKRVTRAVERLREFFTKRGIAIGAGGLAVVISANAVQAAPAGLAAAISSAAVLAGTTIATTTTATLTKAIAMTTLQKTLITVTIAVTVGTGIYQARQASIMRDQVQQQAEQIQQLHSERDGLANRLSVLADGIQKEKGDSSELLKLRAEVARLRGDSQELAQLKANDANDPAQAELKAWLARVKQLKQGAEANPKLQIPEFQFLTDQDWLQAAKWYGKRPQFDAETDFKVAMAEVRQSAQNEFAALTQQALENYAEANQGRFPTDLAELKPYFGQSLDDAVLQRYTIAPAGDFGLKGENQDWVMTQKALVDPDYDHFIGIGPMSWGYKQSLMDQLGPDQLAAKQILDPLAKEFSAANNGQAPNDPSQLLPFVKTPEQQSALQKLIETRNAAAKP